MVSTGLGSRGEAMRKKAFGERRKKDTHPCITDIAVFGWSLFARPGLDLKSRELCQIAALTCLKLFDAPMKVHLEGALNSGASQTEIEEVILQMAPYASIAATRYAMETAHKVFAEHKPPTDLPGRTK